MGTCNHCLVKGIEDRAKAEGCKTFRRYQGRDGTIIYKTRGPSMNPGPNDIVVEQVAFFSTIPKVCVCEEAV